MSPDVVVIGGPNDTVFLLEPKSDEAIEWLHSNTLPEDWNDSQLVVGHHFVDPIIEDMEDAGFILELQG